MAVCPSLSPDGPFVQELLGYVDCQAQTIGAAGYQALAASGSTASIALTAALTLFVAMFGYRMLFGQVPDARGAVVAVVKVGIVLALATSWSAYRTVVYDVTLRSPAELSVAIGGASALPGASGGLVGHLQAVDDGLAELVLLGTGRPPDPIEPVNPTAQPLTPEQQQQRFQQLGQRPRWDPQRDAELLSTARTVYLTGTIGALAAVRLMAGLLLALGPLFALFLLFDTTRGVFEDWVRALGGAALGGLSTAILLGVELAVVEPWLAAILAERRAEIATPAVSIELLALTLVFALTLLAGLIASARIAHGFRIPLSVRDVSARLIETLQSSFAGERADRRAADRQIDAPERSRALAIADAAAASHRRETVGQTLFQPGQFSERGSSPQTPARGQAVVTVIPIGQSARKRTTSRISAGAKRREAL